jgi:acyl-CoA thioesterase
MTQPEQPSLSMGQLIEATHRSGFFQLLGMHIATSEPGTGKVHITVDERLMHPQMIVHGGVIFTLADTAMSFALLSLHPAGTRISTIEAKINYLLPVRAGELLAKAQVTHHGRSIAVLEATVYNGLEQERKAVARILGTFNIAAPRHTQ